MSDNFPTASALFGSLNGVEDAFVSKISADGASLIYSTYLGGSSADEGGSIALDSTDNAYIMGDTASIDFPTAMPLQGSNGGSWDVFVSKISADGSSLLYSTYLGGSEDDYLGPIAVDASGNAYIAGTTMSSDFPTAMPFQASYNGLQDAFVSKISADGASLIYSTYLGGNGDDNGFGIAVDASGNAYIAGLVDSDDFPTASPLYANHSGLWDAFVSKLSADGTSLIYSTYLGGSGDDAASGIAVDSDGNAYIAGDTTSIDFPTAMPLQGSNNGSWDAFVSKISADGASLIYSTYLGGSGEDGGVSSAIDDSGNIYITGYTFSNDFPTAMPFQASYNGLQDAFVCKIAPFTSSFIVSNTTANPNPVAINTACTITAQIDDTASNISYAEYSTDGGIQWYNMDAITAGTNSVNVSVTMSGFTESKLLTVSVRGTNEEGNTSEPESIYLPVYDPSAGFVTGGGWIWSPQGAYVADTSLEGKANFGFVAKYKKGANTPDGNTEFQFKTANLNFHSNTYEWLVVAGYKAMFKGTGTINGEGSYKFIISAIDGSLKDSSTQDKFRIRIWEEDGIGGETTIYDNQMADDMDADATTTLGGGSIIIHKVK